MIFLRGVVNSLSYVCTWLISKFAPVFCVFVFNVNRRELTAITLSLALALAHTGAHVSLR